MENNKENEINYKIKEHKSKLGRNLIYLILFLFSFLFYKFLEGKLDLNSLSISLNLHSIYEQFYNQKDLLIYIAIMFTIFVILRKNNQEWESQNFILQEKPKKRDAIDELEPFDYDENNDTSTNRKDE